MASRRTRIKGIANIPQRKKTVPALENAQRTSLIVEKDPEEIPNPITDAESKCCQDEKPLINNEIIEKETKALHTQAPQFDPLQKAEQPVNKEDIQISNVHMSFIKAEVQTEMNPTTTSLENNQLKDVCTVQQQGYSKPTVRRKFLKPTINPNIIKQRNSSFKSITLNSTTLPANDEKLKDDVVKSPATGKIIVLSEITIPKPLVSPKVACNITEQISDALPSENQPLHQEETSSTVIFHNADVLCSDTEYPGPPVSPNKFNRSRIKAIPKLSLRKPSASESEDEGRRYYGRIRNNSVCSAVSLSNQEPQTPVSEDNSQREIVMAPPKKVFRTEQSRRLAEARREFYKKFGANNPDKQKLKMIDLIYYNPTSNPMSQTSPTMNNNNVDPDDVEKPPDGTAEEAVNDNDSDNENDSSFPVPQIKIGPSGEIVLDEQSLVVENTQVAKQKEQIQNSKLVDGDNAGYGVYKRAPRSILWMQQETLRFYKALNVIGTDFTLMTQLFPERSRRELKMKFKKEERTNLQLIDKALKEPCRYNFQDLKREMEVDKQEEAFLQKLKVDERNAKRMKSLEGETNLPFKKRQASLQSNDDQPPQKKARKKRRRKLDIKSVIEDEESVADVSDFTQSDSDCDFEEEEFIPYLKPTRSGRMPKSTLHFNEPLITVPPRPPRKSSSAKPLNPSTGNRSRTVSTSSSIDSSNPENLIPGSVVVTEEETDEGKTRYKVFMVTPEKKLTPLDLDSNLIDRLLKEGRHVTLPLGEVSDLVESNVTTIEDGVESVRPSKEKENDIVIVPGL